MQTLTRHEHALIKAHCFSTSEELAAYAAAELAQLISERSERGEWTNLGLATGSSPVLFYRELLKLHFAGQAPFRLVRIFMLDEYYGLEPDNPLSFRSFINAHLISKLQDFDERHFHIPRGDIPADELAAHCAKYEAAIEANGGIHYQLLGIGRNGHIGFNEPEVPVTSRTGLRELSDATRRDAASDFFGVDNVPIHGVSMGIATILAAQCIRMIATNEGKAHIIRALLQQPATEFLPASALQSHPDAAVYVDGPAASELDAFKQPWSVSEDLCWTPRLIERFVWSRCEALGKGPAEFKDEDLQPQLAALLKSEGVPTAAKLLAAVQQRVAERITTAPGPDPSQSVLVFSPHPDDAEIQLGGCIQELIKRGVRVVVVVMTSGRLAVWDHCAKPVIDRVDALSEWLGISEEEARQTRNALLMEVSRTARTPGEVDSPALAALKGTIRRNEAIAGLTHLGVAPRDIHFLELPFYETGEVEKAPPSEADYQLVTSMLQAVRPAQVYAAGDLSDPHGTHRVCLDIIIKSLQAVTAKEGSVRPELLLYRGAWAEWLPEEMDVIVPLSEMRLREAVAAMRCHKSQIPRAMFPGSDDRPFDERARTRKTQAGEMFSRFGFPMFAAEGFQRRSY